MGDEKALKPVEDVAKEIIEKDAAGDKGRPGKGEAADKPRRATLLIAGVGTVIVLAVGGVVLAEGGDDRAQPADSGGARLIVSGTYAGAVNVGRDPARHACCVKPSTRWAILQVRDTTTGAITITLSDVVEGIDLTGPLGATGERFTAIGNGSVAGRPGTDVSFGGTVTPENGLDGTLTVGGNGTLPTGQAITFAVEMARRGTIP